MKLIKFRKYARLVVALEVVIELTFDCLWSWRLRNWESRERRKQKEYEKERERERCREEEREREAKRLKEFLEDYDDERDDHKYYKWV